ncbi:flagellar assembly protein FliW [Clostridium sp. E02]|uniref:flagellar assembly protein FliW n=1 Tax=Clostridium sp. E02 TaxID=2487134 RepID=UPI000F54098E|nr:flagellar assembly protein FliW [Clostridium sp. E02]
MEIKTQYFGTVSYSENEMIYFPEGLYGFANLKKYVPLTFQENSDGLISLQSIENEKISFIIMNPFHLYSDYNPVLSEEDKVHLNASTCEDNVSYYVICVIQDSMENSTVNLKSPIAVNTESREARQVILENPLYQFRHPLRDFIKREK